jgi:hypothetical protein
VRSEDSANIRRLELQGTGPDAIRSGLAGNSGLRGARGQSGIYGSHAACAVI